jgi:signal transduction histidine kinase
VTITEVDSELRFEVADDGPGFDVAAAAMGHGFVNMRDRLGAIGGTLEIDSAPGQGSRIRGHVPVDVPPPDAEEGAETADESEVAEVPAS